MIVVNEINEELKQIISYVNECSKTAFSLLALELNRFQSSSTEILVPNLHGMSTKPAIGNSRKQWTPERFFKVLAESNASEIIEIFKDIYRWTEETADRVWWGNGIENGSFTFQYLKEGRTISPFTVYTYGKLAIDFGYLLGPLSTKTLEEFHKKITVIPTMQHIPSVFPSKFPSVKIDALRNFRRPEKVQRISPVAARTTSPCPNQTSAVIVSGNVSA